MEPPVTCQHFLTISFPGRTWKLFGNFITKIKMIETILGCILTTSAYPIMLLKQPLKRLKNNHFTEIYLLVFPS